MILILSLLVIILLLQRLLSRAGGAKAEFLELEAEEGADLGDGNG